MIAIVDYGAGNLRSVANAIAKLGYQPTVTSNPGDLPGAAAVILPGVGAAADTMQNLERLGLSEAIRRVVADGTPMLAICVGMQVLFDETEEGGRHRCLGIIPGTVQEAAARAQDPPHGLEPGPSGVPSPALRLDSGRGQLLLRAQLLRRTERPCGGGRDDRLRSPVLQRPGKREPDGNAVPPGEER